MANVKDFINENLNEEISDEMDLILEDVFNEEMSDIKRKKALKNLNTNFKYDDLSGLWKEKATIAAAGLDYGRIKVLYKEYNDALKKFNSNTTKEKVFGQVGHEKNLASAKEAKDKLKSIKSEINKINAKLVKASKIVASNESKKKVKLANLESKDRVKPIKDAKKKMQKEKIKKVLGKPKKFADRVRSKMKSPGADLLAQFKRGK